MNLIEQSSKWLQSDKCRTGSIINKTEAVISSFGRYVSDEREEICNNTGLPYSAVSRKIEMTSKSIRRILTAFLGGNHEDALILTYQMMKAMKFDFIKIEKPLYKCRANEKMYPFSKNEMFHIPFDKRHLVGNQRFSLSGLPCLYLGGSSYICWEELGRKDFNTSNYCGYSLKENVNVFDLILPEKITNEHQIRRVVLTLACSIAADREHIFKPEYILPQCLLHSLIKRSKESQSVFCVRYYSTHLLNGDADYFEHDFSEDSLSRYVNYVFPATSSQGEEYSSELRKVFDQTDTISPIREILLNPSNLLDSNSEDTYYDSQFGLVDSILDKKMGFVSKRKQIEFVVM